MQKSTDRHQFAIVNAMFMGSIALQGILLLLLMLNNIGWLYEYIKLVMEGVIAAFFINSPILLGLSLFRLFRYAQQQWLSVVGIAVSLFGLVMMVSLVYAIRHFN